MILLLWGVLRRRRGLQWAGLIVLFVSSNPLVARYLIRTTEAWAERIPASEATAADAIVVLSVGRVQAPGPARISEWADANRFFAGVELFEAGKAPLLVFTAPWVPWDPDAPTEGTLLAQYARALGIPEERIAVTGRVSNTADEAREVSALLRARQKTVSSVLLVTSAFHMPRARQVFAQAGLTVTPFPVDFSLSEGGRLPGVGFLPSVGALGVTQTALRELYGRAFYWLRGTF